MIMCALGTKPSKREQHHNLCYSSLYFSTLDHKLCESRCYHNIIPRQRTLLLAVIHLSMSLKIVKEYLPCMFMCPVAMKVVLRKLTALV